MIKVYSSAPSDLFFPDPKDPKGEKGILLKRGFNEFDPDTLPPDVWRRIRVMHEDTHAIIETSEEIPPLDGLSAIHVTEKSVIDQKVAADKPVVADKPEIRPESRLNEHASLPQPQPSSPSPSSSSPSSQQRK